MQFCAALASIWVWFEMVVVTAVGWLLLVLFSAVVAPWDPQRRRRGRFFRATATLIARLSGMWRFAAVPPVPQAIHGRTVVVANHVSHLDSFLIAHLPWEMKWLAKASLFRVPFLGWSMRLAGDIAVVRGTGASIAAAMARCRAYLDADMPVFIFPEGTRSTGAAMLPFKDGAFRLAIAAGAQVLPLAVAGTQRGLPKHSWRFAFCRGRVAVGQPIATVGMGAADVGRLRDAAQAQILRMRAELEPQVAPRAAAAVPGSLVR